MQKQIYPCLWFNGNAKEAALFYTSIFSNSRIVEENHFVANFESYGQKFMCLNGGPEFTPNPSVSFFVTSTSEEEIETLWKKLSDKGQALMPLDKYEWSPKYGWVQDKFGINWQLHFGKIGSFEQKFVPALMFNGANNGKAKEAIDFYTSVFPGSSVSNIFTYQAGEGDTEGNIKHAQFSLNGNPFVIMDSGYSHPFNFNEAVSLVVECDTQAEIDTIWEKLTDEGEESQCGWLKDKYGVSWQIVPSILKELMTDPIKSQKVVEAFMKMRKFEIEKLYV